MKRSISLKTALQHAGRLFSKNALAAALLLTLGAADASAQHPCRVNSLVINTGYDPATNTTLGNQASDPRWSITALSAAIAPLAPQSPSYSAIVVVPNSGNGTGWWSASNAMSRWLTFNNQLNPAYPTQSGVPNNTYSFTASRTFTLCTADNISFSMNVASDNYVEEIRVDGSQVFTQPVTTGNANLQAFTTVPTFSLVLSAGTHTIDVVVNNAVQQHNANLHGFNLFGSITSLTNSNSIVSEDPSCASYVCCDPDFRYCAVSSDPFTYEFTPVSPTQQSAFDWYIDGAYTGSGALQHTFPGAGNYLVCLIINRECYKCINLCIDAPRPAETTGFGDRGTSGSLPGIKVYPNPTSGETQIEFLNKSKGQVTVKLYGMDGQLLSSQTHTMDSGKQKLPVDLKKQSAGVYMIELTDGKNVTRQTVVKE